MTTPYDDLRTRALLILILERQDKMQITVDGLQTQVGNLTTATQLLATSLSGEAIVSAAAITALENFSQQLSTLPATQTAIDALAASVATTVTSIQASAAEATAQTAATQAELDKLFPPTPPTT